MLPAARIEREREGVPGQGLTGKGNETTMVKYVVRYGAMRALGLLSPRGNDRYRRGDRVIARTNRGLEACDVLCVATEEILGNMPDVPHGQILREMTSEDANELTHIKSYERQEFEICAASRAPTGIGDAADRHRASFWR